MFTYVVQYIHANTIVCIDMDYNILCTKYFKYITIICVNHVYAYIVVLMVIFYLTINGQRNEIIIRFKR
jgi:hypothetical protein